MQDNSQRTELIADVRAWGGADAESGKNPADVKPVLYSKAAEIVTSEESVRKGIFERDRLRMDQLKGRSRKLAASLDRERKLLSNTPEESLSKVIFYWMLPALTYILCDIFFSKELIVQGWGLGLENPIEKWSLALGIGLAPFFIKILFDRFLEPGLVSESDSVKRFIKAVYIILGISILLAFLQVAYLRAVIFRFTKISLTGNIYDTLYSDHFGLMIGAFIAVAFMFAVGGGLLLSIASTKLSQWSLRRKCISTIQKLELALDENRSEKCVLTEDISKYLSENSLRSSYVSERIDDLGQELEYHYDSAYSSMQAALDQESLAKEKEEALKHSDDQEFHEYVRKTLDNESRNKKSHSGNGSYV